MQRTVLQFTLQEAGQVGIFTKSLGFELSESAARNLDFTASLTEKP
jgi:hypothetical protein